MTIFPYLCQRLCGLAMARPQRIGTAAHKNAKIGGNFLCENVEWGISIASGRKFDVVGLRGRAMARPYLLIKQLQRNVSPKWMWSILYLNRIAP